MSTGNTGNTISYQFNNKSHNKAISALLSMAIPEGWFFAEFGDPTRSINHKEHGITFHNPMLIMNKSGQERVIRDMMKCSEDRPFSRKGCTIYEDYYLNGLPSKVSVELNTEEKERLIEDGMPAAADFYSVKYDPVEDVKSQFDPNYIAHGRMTEEDIFLWPPQDIYYNIQYRTEGPVILRTLRDNPSYQGKGDAVSETIAREVFDTETAFMTALQDSDHSSVRIALETARNAYEMYTSMAQAKAARKPLPPRPEFTYEPLGDKERYENVKIGDHMYADISEKEIYHQMDVSRYSFAGVRQEYFDPNHPEHRLSEITALVRQAGDGWYERSLLEMDEHYFSKDEQASLSIITKPGSTSEEFYESVGYTVKEQDNPSHSISFRIEYRRDRRYLYGNLQLMMQEHDGDREATAKTWDLEKIPGIVDILDIRKCLREGLSAVLGEGYSRRERLHIQVPLDQEDSKKMERDMTRRSEEEVAAGNHLSDDMDHFIELTGRQLKETVQRAQEADGMGQYPADLIPEENPTVELPEDAPRSGILSERYRRILHWE